MRGLIGRLSAALLVVLLAAPATTLGSWPAVPHPADSPPHADALAPRPAAAPSVDLAVAPTGMTTPPALDVPRPPTGPAAVVSRLVAGRLSRVPARVRPAPRVLRL